MNKNLVVALLMFIVSTAVYAYDKDDSTNDFYDNQPTVQLKQNEIKIYGEIENPGRTVDFSKLPKHSVIAKETILKDNKDSFVGTYIYSGYSLYDILNEVMIKRKNGDFKSPVDLYVKIENDKGESIVVSWGEIYYPSARFQNIIATEVSPILPHAVDIKWPIPEDMRVVIGEDLVTERNISSPTKITIEPIAISDSEKSSFGEGYSEKMQISDKGNKLAEINIFPEEYKTSTYPCIFYGRGRGIHGVDNFNGVPLKYVLSKYFPVSKENLMNGLFAVIAKDGYRCSFSFSEIFNKNNHAEVILLNETESKTDGKFKLFPGNDFFSDRAIKTITEIKLSNIK